MEEILLNIFTFSSVLVVQRTKIQIEGDEEGAEYFSEEADRTDLQTELLVRLSYV